MASLTQLPPSDLDPWQMVLGADSVVKAVMAILLLASVATWTILLAKSLALHASGAHTRKALALAREATSLDDYAGRAEGAQHMLDAAIAERRLSEDLPKEGVRERVALRLQRVEAAMTRSLGRGVGILASIGSTAPFIGLFGTVWGIMNAFVGISKAQTTSLAVVAPGIAEALLATAAGLVAAIPAVLIYNIFSRMIAARRGELGDLSALIQVLLSRDLDRARPPRRQPERPMLLRKAAE